MRTSSRSRRLADLENARLLAEHIRALVHGAQLALDAAVALDGLQVGIRTADALLDLVEQQRRALLAILEELAQAELRAA